MALAIKRRPRARQDLLEIWTFIAEQNEAAADRFLDKVGIVLRMLADNPEAGRSRAEISGGLRSFPVGAYGVYYRVIGADLVLTRVVSGYRDFETIDFE